MMLRIDDLSRLLRASRSSIYKALTAEEIPQPRKVCGIVVWPRKEIERWVLDGCPHVKNEGWKWKAVEVVNLSTLQTVLLRQIADARAELASVQAAIRRGEKTLEVMS